MKHFTLGPSMRRIGHLCCLPVLVSVVGCGAPVFPKELFTVEATGADYPVMLSRAPAKDGGRPIQAESGTHFAQSSSSYRAGNTQVTVTTTERGQSEMAASEKFSAKVRRSDRWVQLETAVYDAEDNSGYGSSSADRNLALAGQAHQ